MSKVLFSLRFYIVFCLKGLYRFATELSGRKGRRKAWHWAGLADEMTQAGWFEN
jgi:hypothetical protein